MTARKSKASTSALRHRRRGGAKKSALSKLLEEAPNISAALA